MTDRATFMAGVRAALEHPSASVPSEAPPNADPSPARLAHAGDAIVEMFAKNAEAVGMHVRRCTASQITTTVGDILRENNAKQVAVGGGIEVGEGFELFDWRSESSIDGMFDLDAGVTDVQCAIAESGTLVLSSDGQEGRGLSLIPTIHIAVVRVSQVVPDQFDFWKQAGTVPSSIVFITGPSKTADIEGELIQGVHGPREVFIVLAE